jgi:hypothetical protein
MRKYVSHVLLYNLDSYASSPHFISGTNVILSHNRVLEINAELRLYPIGNIRCAHYDAVKRSEAMMTAGSECRVS